LPKRAVSSYQNRRSVPTARHAAGVLPLSIGIGTLSQRIAIRTLTSPLRTVRAESRISPPPEVDGEPPVWRHAVSALMPVTLVVSACAAADPKTGCTRATSAFGRFYLFATPSGNDRYLRIPAVHYSVIRISESLIAVPRSRPERTDSNSGPSRLMRGQRAATRESKWMVLVFHCS
jgi:hypothetical protein